VAFGLTIGNMLPKLATPVVVILLAVGIVFGVLSVPRRKKVS